ncbi:hypothetical protein NBM05_07260 [Rothia sp. AR01]|uniref:Uncharacterized protein n=1 Tax=Rothia santali TaxID=2949643 RepID=A0A9X2HEK3_9MICC|nr:hypothetical protein [Rothia santali]MCP3425809.1 hypothetical protein [Rothia santali]
MPTLSSTPLRRLGPWTALFKHTPLYWAGLLVVWGSATVDRLAQDIAGAPSTLHEALPLIQTISWLVLVAYSGFLVLLWPRAESFPDLPSGLPHRLVRAVPPTVMTVVFLTVIQAGVVLIEHLAGSVGPERPLVAATVYGLEAASGAAAFCALMVAAASLASRIRSRALYVLLGWAGYLAVTAVQSLVTTLVISPGGGRFWNGISADGSGINVYLNAIPLLFPSSVPGRDALSTGAPEMLSVAINLVVTAACVAIAVSRAAAERAEERPAG